MDRFALFQDMMAAVIKAKDYINAYDSVPRNYGTDEVLYQMECHTIAMIGDNPGINVTGIARRMKKTKSASSQIIDKLAKRGFVVKGDHPENNRSYVLSLTPKGEAVYQYHKRFDMESYKEIMASLDDFSLADFHIYLELQKRINQQLRANSTRAAMAKSRPWPSSSAPK